MSALTFDATSVADETSHTTAVVGTPDKTRTSAAVRVFDNSEAVGRIKHWVAKFVYEGSTRPAVVRRLEVEPMQLFTVHHDEVTVQRQ